MRDAWRWGGSAPRRLGSSGDENSGGELAGVENQGRSLAIRRGEGGERQRRDGVGPGKAGKSVVSQKAARAVGGRGIQWRWREQSSGEAGGGRRGLGD